jgi:SSS family solute:Na+ symporter
MNNDSYKNARVGVEQQLAAIANEQVRHQMTVPLALTAILPIGLMGVLVAVMLAAAVTTDDTYLHSWGSILVQDVLLPIRQTLLRKDKPLSPQAHMWWLRLSIGGVAIFAFFFSLLFVQRLDIMMYFVLTGMLATAWIGGLQIGGLYWKRGTSAGAWATMITGILVTVATFFLTQVWTELTLPLIQQHWPALHNWMGQYQPAWLQKAPVTPQIAVFFGALLCLLVYFVVSLLSSKGEGYDLDRLLHRGRYARKSDQGDSEPVKPRKTWKEMFKMGKEFKLDDKIIYMLAYTFILGSIALLILGTLYALVFKPSKEAWLTFWEWYTIILIVFNSGLVLLLIVGGFKDLKRLFRTLGTAKRDARDDGTVVDHRNLDEIEETAEVPEETRG